MKITDKQLQDARCKGMTRIFVWHLLPTNLLSRVHATIFEVCDRGREFACVVQQDLKRFIFSSIKSMVTRIMKSLTAGDSAIHLEKNQRPLFTSVLSIDVYKMMDRQVKQIILALQKRYT